MDKQMIPTETLPPNLLPKANYVSQKGKNILNVNNNQGGIVNLTVNLIQPENDYNAEKMMAIRSFSRDYYQLLVTCEECVFKGDVITIPKDRALTQQLVPPEILERCSSLSDAGIKELKTFPAIICRENEGYSGVAGSDQTAIYGYIERIKEEGRNIKVTYRVIDFFTQQSLCEKRNATYFDLTMDCAITDLNISAWSVHKVNLFEAFEKAGITELKGLN